MVLRTEDKRTMVLTVGLFALALVAATLTGVTFSRWMDSYQTLRQFDVEFLAVGRGTDSEYAVEVLMANRGTIPSQVESAMVLLQWRGQLIADTRWYPAEFVLSPGEESLVLLDLETTLSHDYLPPEDAVDDWSLRVHLVMRHAVKDGRFNITLDRELGANAPSKGR